MPSQDIIQFILIIAPGFLVLYVYRSHYPARRVSQFTEITLSVVYGVAIYTAIVWIDLTFLGGALFKQIHLLALALLTAGFVVGQLWVFLRYFRFNLPKWFPSKEKVAPKHKKHQSVWPLVANSTNWAVVFLNDGSIYMGEIDYFTFDPNTEHQDFLLKNARRINENLEEIYLITGIGVYLNTRDVVRIEFLA